MNIEELRDYNKWIGKSPKQILDAVKNRAVGSWKDVFPDNKRLPVWAHRVRNYFNREPLILIRLDENESNARVTQVYKIARPGKESRVEKVKRVMALTDYVYTDDKNAHWFQMTPGGSIYHFKEVENETKEGIYQHVVGQSLTPIFKLVSPDGTGGSMETIILNLGIGIRYVSPGFMPPVPVPNDASVITGVGVPVPAYIYKHIRYQGSYNYAETVAIGNADHDRLDVQPHKEKDYQKYGGYVNPKDRHLELELRRFEKYAPGEEGKQKPLAEQV